VAIEKSVDNANIDKLIYGRAWLQQNEHWERENIPFSNVLRMLTSSECCWRHWNVGKFNYLIKSRSTYFDPHAKRKGIWIEARDRAYFGTLL